MSLLGRIRSAHEGVETVVHYDEHTDTLGLQRTQDVEPILERNKALYNLDDGYSPSREWRRVASIPLVIVEQWYKAGINIFDDNHHERIAAALDSPEFRYLRTAPGRVSGTTPHREFYMLSGKHSARKLELPSG